MKTLAKFIFVLFIPSFAMADRPNEDSIVEAWLRFQGMYVTDVIVDTPERLLRYGLTHREVYFERGNLKYNCYIENIVIENSRFSYNIEPLVFSQCEEVQSGEDLTLLDIKARHSRDNNNNVNAYHSCPRGRFMYLIRENRFDCNGDGYVNNAAVQPNNRNRSSGRVFFITDGNDDATPPAPPESRRGGRVIFLGGDDDNDDGD